MMKDLLLKTNSDWSGFILRLTVGLIMLPHGLQKLTGWFGGSGFTATMNYFTGTMKLPWIISFLIILIESIGAIGLISGTLTRLWAFSFIVIMMGAIVTTNFKNGLFMNWYGMQGGEGYEYHVLVIGMCIALFITGGGKFSADGLLNR